MQTSSKWVTLFIAVLLTASTLAVAADAKPAKEPTSGMSRMGNRDMQHGMAPGGTMSEGMMGGGMMGGGMMGMMNACGGMMNGAAMPQLPPGNEKLQMKMQGEMLQKMGETLSKYADQVKEGKAGNP